MADQEQRGIEFGEAPKSKEGQEVAEQASNLAGFIGQAETHRENLERLRESLDEVIEDLPEEQGAEVEKYYQEVRVGVERLYEDFKGDLLELIDDNLETLGEDFLGESFNYYTALQEAKEGGSLEGVFPDEVLTQLKNQYDPEMPDKILVVGNLLVKPGDYPELMGLMGVKAGKGEEGDVEVKSDTTGAKVGVGKRGLKSPAGVESRKILEELAKGAAAGGAVEAGTEGAGVEDEGEADTGESGPGPEEKITVITPEEPAEPEEEKPQEVVEPPAGVGPTLIVGGEVVEKDVKPKKSAEVGDLPPLSPEAQEYTSPTIQAAEKKIEAANEKITQGDAELQAQLNNWEKTAGIEPGDTETHGGLVIPKKPTDVNDKEYFSQMEEYMKFVQAEAVAAKQREAARNEVEKKKEQQKEGGIEVVEADDVSVKIGGDQINIDGDATPETVRDSINAYKKQKRAKGQEPNPAVIEFLEEEAEKRGSGVDEAQSPTEEDDIDLAFGLLERMKSAKAKADSPEGETGASQADEAETPGEPPEEEVQVETQKEAGCRLLTLTVERRQSRETLHSLGASKPRRGSPADRLASIHTYTNWLVAHPQFFLGRSAGGR